MFTGPNYPYFILCMTRFPTLSAHSKRHLQSKWCMFLSDLGAWSMTWHENVLLLLALCLHRTAEGKGLCCSRGTSTLSLVLKMSKLLSGLFCPIFSFLLSYLFPFFLFLLKCQDGETGDHTVRIMKEESHSHSIVSSFQTCSIFHGGHLQKEMLGALTLNC